MKTLAKTKLSDMAAESIVSFIIENELQPGDKLPTEKEISLRLGIGRTSVREGISQLETVGLLERQQGYGLFLKEVTLDSFFRMKERFSVASFMSPTPKEILDFLDTRLIIETAACEMAADNIMPKAMKSLEDHHRHMSGAMENRKKFMSHDLKFHSEIVQASGNTILPKMLGLIQDLFYKQLFIFAGYPRGLDKALDFHGRILEGLRKKDKAMAAGVMREHILDMKQTLEKRLSL